MFILSGYPLILVDHVSPIVLDRILQNPTTSAYKPYSNSNKSNLNKLSSDQLKSAQMSRAANIVNVIDDLRSEYACELQQLRSKYQSKISAAMDELVEIMDHISD